MWTEPVTIMVPAIMGELRQKTKVTFAKLERQAKTSKLVSLEELDTFFSYVRTNFIRIDALIDQHTGGEEFMRRWWGDFFIPRFTALERAREAQRKRLARQKRLIRQVSPSN